MLLGDPLDPVTYYCNLNLSTVEWPPLDIPPDLIIPPEMSQEPAWTPEEWLARNLGSNYESPEFIPSLSAENIENLWHQTQIVFHTRPMDRQALQFLLDVAAHGHSSGLHSIVSSAHPNVALESRLWTPAVVVLSQWLKKRFICGPFLEMPFSPGKCNGLLLIPKGSSNVRICSDYSRPLGLSFNSCVDPSFKKQLPLRIADFSSVKRALLLAGRSAYIMKNDIVDAYKRIRVSMAQVPAQQFKFGSCFFYDASLIFGDCSAVHSFSFIHNGIVNALVAPYASLPQELSLICIDDLCCIAPESQVMKLWEFYYRYEFVMNKIGFQLQPWSEDRLKSFGPSQSGLLLGVWVSTKDFTWNFPPRKLSLLLEFIEHCIQAPALSLNTLQKLGGKLNYLKSIDDSFGACSGFVLHQLSAYLKVHKFWSRVPISQQPLDIVLSKASIQDLMVVRTLLNILQSRQFPLEQQDWHAQSRTVFTDASGVLGQGVGGVLLCTPTKGFSIPLPDDLLQSGLGHVFFIQLSFRTCTLELLPVWASLMIFASDLKHTRCVFYLDNEAATIALRKKTSNDYATMLLLRLIYFTASLLDSTVEAHHVHRRSSVYTKIADDLTHFSPDSMFRADPQSTYAMVDNLPPITLWMSNFTTDDPSPIFHAIMAYMNSYTAVKYLSPQQGPGSQ